MSRKIPYKSLNNKENVIMYYQGGHNELVFLLTASLHNCSRFGKFINLYT